MVRCSAFAQAGSGTGYVVPGSPAPCRYPRRKTLYASTGRWNPLSTRSPSSSASTSSSTTPCTRPLIRICPLAASAAQARGQVGDRADRGVVEPALEADPPQRRVAHRDPDPEAQLVPLPAPAPRQLGHPLAHRDGHPHRPLGVVGLGHRVVEEHHQPVAREVLDRAPEARGPAPRAPRGTRRAPPSPPPARRSRRRR